MRVLPSAGDRTLSVPKPKAAGQNLALSWKTVDPLPHAFAGLGSVCAVEGSLLLCGAPAALLHMVLGLLHPEPSAPPPGEWEDCVALDAIFLTLLSPYLSPGPSAPSWEQN